MKITNSLPYLVMVLVQCLIAGATITMKIGLANGLNVLVLVIYRHLISMLLFFPFASVFERKERPSLSFVVLIKIFLLTSLGSTIHLNAYCAGLRYTSPTVASSLNCVTPILTFIIAFILRMERVKITSLRGQAKVVGTFICIAGILVVTFWKGGFRFKALVDRPVIDIYSKISHGVFKHNKEDSIKGAGLILAAKVAWSLWLIFQGVVHKIYPAPLSMNMMICFFASLQSSLLALFFARDANLWKLQWDVNLLAIIYGAVMISGLTYYLMLWCICKKGPVFAAMFSPLQIPIVAIFSVTFFSERLHIGSLIGAFLIIVGLYTVLWGKSNDNIVNVTSENGKDEDKKLETDVEENVTMSPREIATK